MEQAIAEDRDLGLVLPLDQLDRRIIAALQINPRATWRQIAEAVETTESTARRHAERLVQAGAIRITTTSAMTYPDTYVMMQFACEPVRAAEVGRTLAARDDVRFVALVTGPFDVVAEVLAPSHRHLARVLVEELPAIVGISRTTTETELRNFKTAYDWSADLLGDRAAALNGLSRPLDEVSPFVDLDDIDRRLIDRLKIDGRASYAELAAACDVTESTARRRTEHLFSRAGVRPITLVDPQVVGYEAEMLLWLRVDLAQLEQVAKTLAGRREVRYISATSGYSDLVCEVIMRSKDDLYMFLTGVLGKLPGIREVNTATELITLKRAHVRLDYQSSVWSASQGGNGVVT